MRSRKRSLQGARQRQTREGEGKRWQFLFVLPVNIISGRQSRSTEPGARLGDDDDDANDQPIEPASPVASRFDPHACGDGTKRARAPFAESSRFFNILLNVAYLFDRSLNHNDQPFFRP